MATAKSMGMGMFPTANLKPGPARTLANPGPIHVTGTPGTGPRRTTETAGSWPERNKQNFAESERLEEFTGKKNKNKTHGFLFFSPRVS